MCPCAKCKTTAIFYLQNSLIRLFDCLCKILNFIVVYFSRNKFYLIIYAHQVPASLSLSLISKQKNRYIYRTMCDRVWTNSFIFYAPGRKIGVYLFNLYFSVCPHAVCTYANYLCLYPFIYPQYGVHGMHITIRIPLTLTPSAWAGLGVSQYHYVYAVNCI